MANQTIHGISTDDIKRAIVELITETPLFNEDRDVIKNHVISLKALYDYVEDAE